MQAGETSGGRALCLSGGGIRSATFGLGILQALAAAGELRRFDYLSTVSGGGYIGAWLTAWSHRAGGVAAVEAELAAAESAPLRHLRAYSSYLAPRRGAFSADTWTLAAIYLCNLLLNWLVFVPLLLLLLLGPRIGFVLGRAAAPWARGAWAGGAALGLLVVAGGLIAVYLPSLGGRPCSAERFRWTVLLPIGLAVALGTLWLWNARSRWPPLHLARGAAAGFAVAAPVLLLMAVALAGVLFLGLTSQWLHTLDREWLGRAGADLLRLSVVWAAAFAIVLLAPAALQRAWAMATAGGVGGVSGVLTALLGFRDKATAVSGTAKVGGSRWLQAVAALFLVLLAAGLVALTNHWLGADAAHSGLTPTLLLAAGLLAWVLVSGWFININKFSLMGMYRNRLIRAYLGASRHAPANGFSGFAPGDDVGMSELQQARPYPVLNLTLNLVSGERLAWQERKAELFTVTPQACGCPTLGYQPSAEYAGGMTLGTAMALSGAALSPNMGYHSSPLVAFVMTLFDVRLGAWLGNPAGRRWRQPGPRNSFSWLLREALGRTDARSPFVYLSDGGHFENLGLYAMVRRGCREIVVVDAGCDPDYRFEDLGNALRKIRIDLGVEIVFAEEPSAMRAREKRWAEAVIRYSNSPDGCADGRLIYLKPMLLANESPDVASYAAAHRDFPHQSTADQWFDESQTESYRQLGLQTAAEWLQQRARGAGAA